MPRHICMVGTAASRVSAPVDNPDIEVWGVSSRGNLRRATRWFELHPIDNTFDKPGEADQWREAVKAFTADIPELWMLFPEPGLHKNVVTYPIERIKARFGTDHMGSTFSWMMAIAIDEMAPIDPDGTRHFAEKGSKISIYGVDMEHGTEYEEQRRGFKAMMSIAEQLGIEIYNVLSGGLIYDPVPYPLWQIDPLICKVDLRLKESNGHVSQIGEALEASRANISATKGAISEVQMMLGAAGIAKLLEGEADAPKPYVPEDRLTFLNKQLENLQSASAKMSADFIGWTAVNDEQKWLRSYLMG